MDRIGKRAKALVLLVVLLLGGWGVFVGEYLWRGERWAAAEGNPHDYKYMATDANGVLLRDTANGIYADNGSLRRSVVHWVGDRDGKIRPAVMERFRGKLVGFHPVTGIYSSGDPGVATLTLLSKVQIAAMEAMDGHSGTVAVYNYKTGALLCAVSTPGIDPDGPDGTGEGRFMNRFMQGVYTPGSIFKTVTAGAALTYLPDILQQQFQCTGKVEYGNTAVTCEKVHGKMDLYGAMRESCNCAFASIAEQLGAKRLQAFADQCGVTDSLMLDGVATAQGNVSLDGASSVELAWAGIGQHEDLVNPARFLTFMGAVANGGVGCRPYIMEKITKADRVVHRASQKKEKRCMSRTVATQLQKILRNNVKNKYGDENFPGLSVCAKTGTAQVGNGKKPTAMLAGFVSDKAYPLAFIVTVEEGGYGRTTCIPIIAKVLSACRTEMDKKR